MQALQDSGNTTPESLLHSFARGRWLGVRTMAMARRRPAATAHK